MTRLFHSASFPNWKTETGTVLSLFSTYNKGFRFSRGIEINSENAKQQKFVPFSICYTTSIMLHKNKHCQSLWASFNLLICKTEQEQQPYFITLLLDTDQHLCQHDTVSVSKRQVEKALFPPQKWVSRSTEGFGLVKQVNAVIHWR